MINSKNFLDFVCVAAPRSGTTWLAKALGEHPQIWIPPAKELNFFNKPFLTHLEFKYTRGIEYYKKQFSEAQSEALIGELTPTYYVDDGAAERIAEHFPNTRILILLRNPADVVFSTYLKSLEYGASGKTFESALEAQPELYELGFYHKLLTPYFNLFPRDRIYVGIHEVFFNNIAEETSKVYRFLGVDDKFTPSILETRINQRKEVRSPAFTQARHALKKLLNRKSILPLKRLLTHSNLLERLDQRIVKLNLKTGTPQILDDHTRQQLMQLYESDIADLEKLIEFKLNLWRTKKT